MQEGQERGDGRARIGSERLAEGIHRSVPGSSKKRAITKRSNDGASAEARYRAVFESANDAILIVDRNGHCIDANPTATELLGYERQELLSMPILDLVAAEPP